MRLPKEHYCRSSSSVGGGGRLHAILVVVACTLVGMRSLAIQVAVGILLEKSSVVVVVVVESGVVLKGNHGGSKEGSKERGNR